MSSTLTFQVDDMTCGHCASTSGKVVADGDRDAKVAVDLASHLVRIESSRAGAEAFREAIREAGYTPVAVGRGSAA